MKNPIGIQIHEIWSFLRKIFFSFISITYLINVRMVSTNVREEDQASCTSVWH